MKAFAHLGLFPGRLSSAVGSDPTAARRFRANKTRPTLSGQTLAPHFHFSSLGPLCAVQDRCSTGSRQTASPLAPLPRHVAHQRAQLPVDERDGRARGGKVCATTSPLAGARAHRWVDAPPSSGFWVAPYGVLDWRWLDGRASTSTRTAAHASTRTEAVVTTAASADELESWVAIPEDLFPKCSDCKSGLRRWGKLLKP
jgi:hypothetical protein